MASPNTLSNTAPNRPSNRPLNLGILAHVDAGKTTLTERLLHAAGVIDDIGRVDHGTTRTDSLALERQRGITIKSAVASFDVDGVTINLLDTPGHPDFIAEVERVLGVLDGAVLVVSAVEGVQAQTVVLSRALRRLGVPTVAFVNKIDRVGADVDAVTAAIADRLETVPIAMTVVRDAGTARATVALRDVNDPAVADEVTEALAAADDAVLARFLADQVLDADALRQAIVDQTARHVVMPVFAGSALAGVGVDELMHALPALLPVGSADRDGACSGTVFKVERGPTGERVAFVRVVTGTLRVRDRVQLAAAGIEREPETVTAIDAFARGATEPRGAAGAGDIVKVYGLSGARIGDRFGDRSGSTVDDATAPVFRAPALETAVVSSDPARAREVFDALTELAAQDPLINLRQDDVRQELFLSLYGEVQKEIVAATLLADHGLHVEFRPTTPVCVERPNTTAAAIEYLPRRRTPHHPLLATVGLTVAPLPPGTGVEVGFDLGVRGVPIHVFDTVDAFRVVMERAVRDTLRQGLHGWPVTDCRVTVTDSDYQAPPRRWPGTTASDYRLLTPLVLMEALRRCGTTVCEPLVELRLELRPGDVGPVMTVLHALDARPGAPSGDTRRTVVRATMRLAHLHRLQQQIPDLTGGEGVLEVEPAGYAPVIGPPPIRPRSGRNPPDRDGYLRDVGG